MLRHRTLAVGAIAPALPRGFYFFLFSHPGDYLRLCALSVGKFLASSKDGGWRGRGGAGRGGEGIDIVGMSRADCERGAGAIVVYRFIGWGSQ